MAGKWRRFHLNTLEMLKERKILNGQEDKWENCGGKSGRGGLKKKWVEVTWGGMRKWRWIGKC